MSTPLVTFHTQNHARSQPSCHNLAIDRFLAGKEINNYICIIERSLDGRSKVLNITTIGASDLQGMLLLCLALWQQSKDSDYCKLFIQITPHYLALLQKANGDVPPILLEDIDTPLKNNITQLAKDTPRRLVTKKAEIKNLLHLVKSHVPKSSFDDIHETAAHAFADWQKITASETHFPQVLSELSKIVAAICGAKQYTSYYSKISSNILAITQRALPLFESCFKTANKAEMIERILPCKPLQELYVKIVTHPSFPMDETLDIIDWSIENGWIDHAVAVVSGYLGAKWKSEEDPHFYDTTLSSLKEIADEEALAPFKYNLLLKIAQKQEEIQSDSRVLRVKQLVALVKGRRD